MFLYTVIIGVFATLSTGKINGIAKKNIWKIGLLFLWVLATIRSVSVGNDTREYMQIFYTIASQPFSPGGYRFETGYILLNYIIGTVAGHFFVLLFVINTIVYLTYAKFIQRYSSNGMLSLVIFVALGFWGSTVNVLRLQLAVAMILCMQMAYEDGKKTSAMLFGILGVLFHRISLLCWITICVPAKRNKKIPPVRLDFIAISQN